MKRELLWIVAGVIGSGSLLVFPLGLSAQCELSLPLGGKGLIIEHIGYLSYDEFCEQAEWVAYELTTTEVAGIVERTDNFQEDPLVITGSAEVADYKGSGYDRGHLAPAADMKWSIGAMSESFYLSNISPQKPGFNRGIWRQLEEGVRRWAVMYGSLQVVTGGILEGGLPTIGENEVIVPAHFYKVLLDCTPPEIKGIGFVVPNDSLGGSFMDYAVSIDVVEHMTGLDFFPGLQDSLEYIVELGFRSSLWISKDSPIEKRQSKTTKTRVCSLRRILSSW